MSIWKRIRLWLSPKARHAHEQKQRRIALVNADLQAGRLVIPRDPYRTAAVVETTEQRVERLRNTYYNIGIMNTPRDPAKRAEALKQLTNAYDAWQAAARVLEIEQGKNIRRLEMTDAQREAVANLFAQPSTARGAGRGTP